MRTLIIGILSTITISWATGQSVQKLEYCNCIDKVEQLSPILNGKYERTCDGKVIETGFFKDGQKDGEWITNNKKGILLKKLIYSSGQLNGKVELFYLNGKPKLNAAFANGEKIGTWTYFTSKGKVLLTGNYEANKPVSIWTLNDKKGKAPAVQYDYSTSKFLVNQPFDLHKDQDIVQNDNTEEYFILRYPARTNPKGTSPLGGFYFADDLFVDLMEIPLDYWDTFTNYKYKAKFITSEESKTTVTIESISEHMADNIPSLPFIVRTNDDNKLKRVTQSELSKKLLEYKILETLNFLPPWVYTDKQETFVYIPYVINQIIGY